MHSKDGRIISADGKARVNRKGNEKVQEYGRLFDGIYGGGCDDTVSEGNMGLSEDEHRICFSRDCFD